MKEEPGMHRVFFSSGGNDATMADNHRAFIA